MAKRSKYNDLETLEKAVVAVLNGMSLKDAERVYSNGLPSFYGRIRGAVFKKCEDRNPEMFNKLRIQDAGRRPSSNKSKNSPSDVSYITLQQNRHHFLTVAEMSDYQAYLLNSTGSRSLDELIKRRTKLEKRLNQQLGCLRSLGASTQASVLFLDRVLPQLEDTVKGIEENDKALHITYKVEEIKVSLCKTAQSFQTLDRIAEYERLREQQKNPFV